MKQIVLVLALVVICSFSAVDASWFSSWFKKYKNGCDPNPCEHKAKCILDAKNNTLFTCECTEGYHGKKCEDKTGCYKNPCKKGKCSNLKSNPSDYVCACDPGYVGKKCDTSWLTFFLFLTNNKYEFKEDPCLKNPCKNGGVCRVNEKTKAECTCPPGWTGSKTCEKSMVK